MDFCDEITEIEKLLSEDFQHKNEYKSCCKESSHNVSMANIQENGKEVFHEDSLFDIDNSENLLVPTTQQYFVCNICDYICKHRNSLQIHMAQHTAEKPLVTCQLCHLKFTQRASLNFHMKKKHLDQVQEKLFNCSSCNFSSDQESNLKTHLCKSGIQTEEVLFKCAICDQKFKKHGDLYAHNWKFHMKKRPIMKDMWDLQGNLFKCSQCNFQNSKKGNLITHMRIHSGEKPFKCQVCPREFTQLCHLQVHKRRHTGEKPFACTFCSCKFSQKSNLVVHNIKCHKLNS